MDKKTKTILRVLGLLIFLGLGIKILLPHVQTIPESIRAIKSLNYWWLLLAILCEFLRFMGNGYQLNTIIGLHNKHVSIWQNTMIALASSSFGMVAGGMVASAAASMQWLRKRNVKLQAASMAGFLPILLNNLAVLLLSLVGVIYLLGLDALTTTQMNAFVIILVLLVGALFLIYLFFRNRENSKKFSINLAQKISIITKKNYDESKVSHQIDEIFEIRERFLQKGWKKPVLSTALIYIFDLLALFFLFLAAGQPISLKVLLIGYALPQLLGKAAFVLPGGIGVVETTMISLYQQIGISNHIAIVVVMAYRFLAFLLPALLGFLFVFLLQKEGKVDPSLSVDLK